MVMRRRAGAEDWDMPEPWPDFADAACAAPVLLERSWASLALLRVPRLIGAPPFAFTTSDDNGATWAPIEFPHFTASIGRYVSQPSTHRAREKWNHLHPTDSTGRDADGNGSISAVWATRDNGRTWLDTGGRTAGRHTTIVTAENGETILGFGGKKLQHRRPHALAPVPTVAEHGRNQRPSSILSTAASGPASFASPPAVSSSSPISIPQRKASPQRRRICRTLGGRRKTWKQKRLPADILTVGYVTATQGPDGLIHIATSKNTVNYEIELNEAWVLTPDAAKPPEADGSSRSKS